MWDSRLTDAIRDAAFDLEEFFTGRGVPESLPVKAAPKSVQPKLNLADYVASEAQPPRAVHRSHLGDPSLADVLGNDEWGDCGDAMAIHAIEAFHLDAGTPVPPFTREDALRLYSEVSGFDPNQGPPGENPTDTGTDNQRLVDHWRDVGVLCAADGSRHKIAGSLFVDPRDDRLTRIAIWEFVAMFRAVGLPLTAQGQSYWKLTDPSLQGDAAVGSWGYHDIPYFSYDTRRLRNDSWGVGILVDWDFDKAYGAQGFVVVTPEQLNLEGVSPAGVNWTQLLADLSRFPAQPQS